VSARPSRLRARAVVIDLDGTLLDTVADLAAAVNLMLAELGRDTLPEPVVASYVGKGADVLVHRALGGGLEARVDSALHARGAAAFARHYTVENGRHARPYDGVRCSSAAGCGPTSSWCWAATRCRARSPTRCRCCTPRARSAPRRTR
jgi:phosphoglycolate phosphatase-like HAD superfamily hydrolase